MPLYRWFMFFLPSWIWSLVFVVSIGKVPGKVKIGKWLFKDKTTVIDYVMSELEAHRTLQLCSIFRHREKAWQFPSEWKIMRINVSDLFYLCNLRDFCLSGKKAEIKRAGIAGVSRLARGWCFVGAWSVDTLLQFLFFNLNIRINCSKRFYLKPARPSTIFVEEKRRKCSFSPAFP